MMMTSATRDARDACRCFDIIVIDALTDRLTINVSRHSSDLTCVGSGMAADRT
jgi:hypothetical protein